MSEIGEDKLGSEEHKTETNNKNTPEELCVIKRFTKQQVWEVYDLLEEGKTFEEISKHFEKKYKCKPLPKDRLRKHLTNFYKLKREREENGDGEGDGDDGEKRRCDGVKKIQGLHPPVSVITNQDIKDISNKLFSPPPTNNLGNNVESVKSGSKETELSLLSGINLKFLVFVVIAIVILLKILLRRKERKAKSKPEPGLQNKSENLSIKWV